MDAVISGFVRAGSLDELKIKGRLLLHGRHRPILVVQEGGRVLALDNRCPHMGFPLDRGSIEDGILTCHWHHARFALASGCTFDLWADDVPTCPVEIRAGGEIWVKPVFGYSDPVGHWRQRLGSMTGDRGQMRQRTTAEVCLGQGKATSCGPARRATRRFACQRGWLRPNFVAVRLNETENRAQQPRNLGNVG